MKQLSTKSVGSLLVATAATIGDAGRAGQKHLDRVLRRHDRKGELRAAILGMDPLEFRSQQQRRTFDELIRLHGFRGYGEFLVALRGKLRAELLARGWSRQRIDLYMTQNRVLAA